MGIAAASVQYRGGLPTVTDNLTAKLAVIHGRLTDLKTPLTVYNQIGGRLPRMHPTINNIEDGKWMPTALLEISPPSLARFNLVQSREPQPDKQEARGFTAETLRSNHCFHGKAQKKKQ